MSMTSPPLSGTQIISSLGIEISQPQCPFDSLFSDYCSHVSQLTCWPVISILATFISNDDLSLAKKSATALSLIFSSHFHSISQDHSTLISFSAQEILATSLNQTHIKIHPASLTLLLDLFLRQKNYTAARNLIDSKFSLRNLEPDILNDPLVLMTLRDIEMASSHKHSDFHLANYIHLCSASQILHFILKSRIKIKSLSNRTTINLSFSPPLTEMSNTSQELAYISKCHDFHSDNDQIAFGLFTLVQDLLKRHYHAYKQAYKIRTTSDHWDTFVYNNLTLPYLVSKAFPFPIYGIPRSLLSHIFSLFLDIFYSFLSPPFLSILCIPKFSDILRDTMSCIETRKHIFDLATDSSAISALKTWTKRFLQQSDNIPLPNILNVTTSSPSQPLPFFDSTFLSPLNQLIKMTPVSPEYSKYLFHKISLAHPKQFLQICVQSELTILTPLEIQLFWRSISLSFGFNPPETFKTLSILLNIFSLVDISYFLSYFTLMTESFPPTNSSAFFLSTLHPITGPPNATPFSKKLSKTKKVSASSFLRIFHIPKIPHLIPYPLNMRAEFSLVPHTPHESNSSYQEIRHFDYFYRAPQNPSAFSTFPTPNLISNLNIYFFTTIAHILRRASSSFTSFRPIYHLCLHIGSSSLPPPIHPDVFLRISKLSHPLEREINLLFLSAASHESAAAALSIPSPHLSFIISRHFSNLGSFSSMLSFLSKTSLNKEHPFSTILPSGNSLSSISSKIIYLILNWNEFLVPVSCPVLIHILLHFRSISMFKISKNSDSSIPASPFYFLDSSLISDERPLIVLSEQEQVIFSSLLASLTHQVDTLLIPSYLSTHPTISLEEAHNHFVLNLCFFIYRLCIDSLALEISVHSILLSFYSKILSSFETALSFLDTDESNDSSQYSFLPPGWILSETSPLQSWILYREFYFRLLIFTAYFDPFIVYTKYLKSLFELLTLADFDFFIKYPSKASLKSQASFSSFNILFLSLLNSNPSRLLFTPFNHDPTKLPTSHTQFPKAISSPLFHFFHLSFFRINALLFYNALNSSHLSHSNLLRALHASPSKPSRIKEKKLIHCIRFFSKANKKPYHDSQSSSKQAFSERTSIHVPKSKRWSRIPGYIVSLLSPHYKSAQFPHLVGTGKIGIFLLLHTLRLGEIPSNQRYLIGKSILKSIYSSLHQPVVLLLSLLKLALYFGILGDAISFYLTLINRLHSLNLPSSSTSSPNSAHTSISANSTFIPSRYRKTASSTVFSSFEPFMTSLVFSHHPPNSFIDPQCGRCLKTYIPSKQEMTRDLDPILASEFSKLAFYHKILSTMISPKNNPPNSLKTLWAARKRSLPWEIHTESINLVEMVLLSHKRQVDRLGCHFLPSHKLSTLNKLFPEYEFTLTFSHNSLRPTLHAHKRIPLHWKILGATVISLGAFFFISNFGFNFSKNEDQRSKDELE